MHAVIAIALIVSLAPPAPVALSAGEPAPFAGVLISAERAVQVAEEEAQLSALQTRVDEQKRITDAVEAFWTARYAALAQQQAQSDWTRDPELRGWGGFALGVVVGVGVLAGGAMLVQAVSPSGGSP